MFIRSPRLSELRVGLEYLVLVILGLDPDSLELLKYP